MLLCADVLRSGGTARFEGLVALGHGPGLQIFNIVGVFCMLSFGRRTSQRYWCAVPRIMPS